MGRRLVLLGGSADVVAEGDGAEVGMLEQVGDVGVDDPVEDDGGVEGFEICELAFDDRDYGELQERADLVDVAHGEGIDDGLLVGEEAVERADGEASLGGDAGGGDVLQRHVGEQRTGRINDAQTGLKTARLDGRATAQW